MKALSIASLFVLGLAGTACSQAAETQAEAQEPEILTADANDDGGGSFNLELPSDTSAGGTASNDGFNLDLPDTGTATTDGFNLGTDLQTSGGLAAVPEIDTSITEIEPEAPADDEPVIRIE
ncbi:MAG: hypothetical protein AAGL11_08895 [Pseudomonadota bacterium]